MISIIICSRRSKVETHLEANIRATIGVPFEIIVIDNSHSEHSILSAYNMGISRSRYPYLCFIHEDILFHTQEWGAKAIAHAQNPHIAFVGIASSHYLPKTITGWGFNANQSMHYLQRMSPNGNAELFNVRSTTSIHNLNSSKAVTVDGLFLFARREIFRSILFDASTYHGFHFYDQDICMQAFSHGFLNLISYDILIEHFSKGNFDRRWIEDAHRWLAKWEAHLPAQTFAIQESQRQNAFWTNACWYLALLLHNRMFLWRYYAEALSYIREIRSFRFFLQYYPWRVIGWFLFKHRF